MIAVQILREGSPKISTISQHNYLNFMTAPYIPIRNVGAGFGSNKTFHRCIPPRDAQPFRNDLIAEPSDRL